MAKRDIIVIGASAGGVEVLKAVIGGLPATLQATVLVVLHIPSSAPSGLPAILARAGKLTVVQPQIDMRLQPGWLVVAPPDHHLTLRGDLVHVSRGPRINGHRPAIDPLFNTAARDAGARVTGVVLSGVLDDGTDGMLSIQRAGGATIVQDPNDALYPGMPRSVLEQMTVDHVLPAARIAAALVELAGQPVPDVVKWEAPMTNPREDIETELTPPGDPSRPASGFTCPECHGALWQVEGKQLERYRCRVGHAYSPKGLFSAQSEAVEDAIWAAYRALEESASLSERLAVRARNQSLPRAAQQYERKAAEARQRSALLRELLENGRLDAEGDEQQDQPEEQDDQPQRGEA